MDSAFMIGLLSCQQGEYCVVSAERCYNIVTIVETLHDPLFACCVVCFSNNNNKGSGDG